jgi:hypothetical protein
MLLRNINKDDDSGKAFQGLVARALRDAGTGVHSQQCVASSLTEPNWMTSLIDWLAKMGLQIVVQGPPPCHEGAVALTGDKGRRINLYDRGIALAGEESTSDEL